MYRIHMKKTEFSGQQKCIQAINKIEMEKRKTKKEMYEKGWKTSG